MLSLPSTHSISIMPNWFQNTLSNVGDAVDNLADDVLDKLGDVLDGLDLGPEMERIKDAAISSNTLAKETTTLCESTHSKADQMMEFCLDLKETLETSTQRGISPETLDTIQDLLSGEKLHTAMELAKEMSLYAKDCVDKSVQMVCQRQCKSANFQSSLLLSPLSTLHKTLIGCQYQ